MDLVKVYAENAIVDHSSKYPQVRAWLLNSLRIYQLSIILCLKMSILFSKCPCSNYKDDRRKATTLPLVQDFDI